LDITAEQQQQQHGRNRIPTKKREKKKKEIKKIKIQGTKARSFVRSFLCLISYILIIEMELIMLRYAAEKDEATTKRDRERARGFFSCLKSAYERLMGLIYL
jgi:hypothetical protein